MRLSLLLLSCYCMLAVACSKKESEPTVVVPIDDTSPVSMQFQLYNVPANVGGYLDIAFTPGGRAALLAANHTVFVAENDTYNFALRYQLSNNAQSGTCIAMEPDNDNRIFVGGTSNNGQYTAKFAILNRTGETLLWDGNVRTFNTAQDVKYDFVQAYWNEGGGIYVTMGNRSTKRSGTLGILTNVGNTNGITLYNTKAGKPYYPSAIMLSKTSSETFIGYTVSVDPFSPTDDEIDMNTDKFFGNWLTVSQYYPVGYPYTIGRNPNSNQSVWMFNAERLFLNGKRVIRHTGLPANNWRSAKVDAKGFVWVCTAAGLYKSATALPS